VKICQTNGRFGTSLFKFLLSLTFKNYEVKKLLMLFFPNPFFEASEEFQKDRKNPSKEK